MTDNTSAWRNSDRKISSWRPAPTYDELRAKVERLRALPTCAECHEALEAGDEWHHDVCSAVGDLKAEVERRKEDLAQADADVETLMGVSERLQAVRRAVDSFDNRDVSATPDQRDVIDAVRYALARPTLDKPDGPGRYGATNRELRAEIERLQASLREIAYDTNPEWWSAAKARAALAQPAKDV